MEKYDTNHQHKLNELTCLALGKIAHVEDTLEFLEAEAKQLLEDINSVNHASNRPEHD